MKAGRPGTRQPAGGPAGRFFVERESLLCYRPEPVAGREPGSCPAAGARAAGEENVPGRIRGTRWWGGAALTGFLAAGLFLVGLLLGGSADAAGPAEGDSALDFRLTLFSGKTFTLGDLKGKPVFLNFFASW